MAPGATTVAYPPESILLQSHPRQDPATAESPAEPSGK